MRAHKGFSLIELMVTLAVFGIMMGIAAPNFNQFLIKIRVDNQISEMQNMILSARNTAINSGHTTILCPLDINGVCTDNWGRELSVFTDLDNNGKFNDSDTLIKIKDAINSNDIALFTGSIISYSPTGNSNLSNLVQFHYCPESKLRHSRGIEISRTGRSVASTYIESAKKELFRSGDSIRCS
ncbi:GspH/FimT family pseudopilin [Thalassotalea aquiviva]|uniref:GspH/FimT family pseudopilin n=1 Tax=Thalassotalea aquiviva TaxID=3242415 RepID=UPI00352A871D